MRATALVALLGACWWSHQLRGVAAQSCAFALSFQCADFLQNASALANFLQRAAVAESAFTQDGVGLSDAFGVTFDGSNIDYQTGAPISIHPFSAASKEAFHAALLALALQPSPPPVAEAWLGGNVTGALGMVARKLDSYYSFFTRYPGFGGFLPWYALNGSGMGLLEGWTNTVPALDNGELFWGLYALKTSLELRGDGESVALAQRVGAQLALMQSNAQRMFWAGSNGTVWSVVSMTDPTLPVSQNAYASSGGMLNDPYEGELFTWVLDFWGTWASEAERDDLWVAKRALLVARNWTAGANTTVTVQQGFWYSSHEVFKLLFLPYRWNPLAAAVFRNGEAARTGYSAATQTAGLHASVSDVAAPGSTSPPDYASDSGIGSLASQPVTRDDLVTPYASWPLFLFNASVGACWYRNMLAGPRMQGPLGSTESVNLNGTEISPVVTWDSKITTLIAMSNGTDALAAHSLQAQPDPLNPSSTLLDRFLFVVQRELSLVFGTRPPLGSNVPLATPTATISRSTLGSFTTCT